MRDLLVIKINKQFVSILFNTYKLALEIILAKRFKYFKNKFQNIYRNYDDSLALATYLAFKGFVNLVI